MLTTAKTAILKFLNRYGYELVRHYDLPPITSTADILEAVVFNYLRKRGSDQLTFVQVGANDGITVDPIRPFLRDTWRGVLVEPNPSVFKMLQSNCSGFPLLELENVAITETDGDMDLFVPKESVDASLRTDVVTPKLGILPSREVVKVHCVTLAALFQKHKITDLDLFLVDAEGYDYKIMRQLLATPVYPAIIQFEHGAMTREEFSILSKLLVVQNYTLSIVNHDTICTRSSSKTQPRS
ncbi:MAG: FkbM family methyltransferase [Limisphaerales bacterium]